MPEQAGSRLFFALWPDDEVRGALARLARSLHAECGGRMMAAHNLHLTLVFVGNVAVPRITELRANAAAVTAPRFELTFETLDYWRHNHVVWAGASTCPDALGQLVTGIRRAVRDAELRCDNRDYVPHITLLRDARRGPAATAARSIVWRAADFALVQSLRRNGATVYEVVERWPLHALP